MVAFPHYAMKPELCLCKQDFPPSFFFGSAVNSAPSRPMHRNIKTISRLNQSPARSSLCLHSTHLQAGYCHRGTQRCLIPSFPQAPFDASTTGIAPEPFVGRAVRQRGPSCATSPAPRPRRPLWLRAAGPAVLMKQRGTAGRLLLGHRSRPWTHCREQG